MPIHFTQPGAFADLGNVWLRDRLARLAQKRAQFGGRHRIDADVLLTQLARAAREAEAAAAPVESKVLTGDRIRPATHEIIEHCSRLDSHVAAAAIAH